MGNAVPVPSRALGAALLALLTSVGCLSSDTSLCGDRICPAGFVCVESLDECVLNEQVDVCVRQAEGADCALAGDTGLCVGGVCRARGCGNGIREAGELCDDGNTDNGDGCSRNCDSLETCGNGIRDTDEGCDCGDGSIELPSGCSMKNSADVGAECRPDCSLPNCGDGVIDGLEECEAGLALGKTCSDFDYHVEAGLACTGCLFDDSGCTQWCGDGKRNGDEDCDGADLGGADCTSLDFYEADTLGCTSFCRFDVSACLGYCGDEVVQGEEICDSVPTPGQSCLDYFVFDVGLPRCNQQCFPDFADCGVMGWRKVGELDSLKDIWGLGPADVFAVGAGIFRFDGASWTKMTAPAGAYTAIYGTSSNNVFAGGSNGKIARFGGMTWTLMTTDATTRVVDLWIAPSGDEGFAVGLQEQSAAPGYVGKLSAGTWTKNLPGGELSPTVSWRGVWGTDMSHVFIVGDGGWTYQWDGAQWIDIGDAAIKSSDNLLDVWGVSPSEVYALEATGKVFRYDGQSWSLFKNLVAFGSNYLAITGTDSDHIWVTGDGRVIRYDGVDWRSQLVDGAGVLNGIKATDSHELFAVAKDFVYRYDGSLREEVDPSPVALDLMDVWGASSHKIFAVGSQAAHYAAGGWSAYDFDSGCASDGFMNGVWGSSPTSVYAVGCVGSIDHWNGSVWTSQSSTVSAELGAIWGAGAADIYAVGKGKTIVHYDGSWASMDTTALPSCDLHAVWGADADNVFAAGGCVFKLDGGSWSDLSYTGAVIHGIWGSAPNDVFFAAENGEVWHYDGESFSLLPTDTTAILYAITGTAHDDVYVAGEGGTLLRYDGHNWIPLESGTNKTLAGLWTDGERMVAAGAGGTIVDFQIANACRSGTEIACGDTLVGSTSTGLSELHAFGCPGAVTFGKEVGFYFDADLEMTVDVEMTPDSADLDLFVVGADAWGACEAGAKCMGRSSTLGPEQISFEARRRRRYWFMVDAAAGIEGDFQISVSCSSSP